MDQKRMGLFIKALRKERELTQEQLAEALYVSSKTVSRWETGSSLPDLLMLQNLADYFEVSITELINGERDENNTTEKETMRKLSEYSDRKERQGFQKLWWIIVIALAAVIVVLVCFLLRSCPKENPQQKPNTAVNSLLELRENYSIVQAEYDGCVVIQDSDLLHGEQLWWDFFNAAKAGTPGLIRIYQTYSRGMAVNTPTVPDVYYLKELAFDGKRYRLSMYDQTGDTKEWFYSEEYYDYLNEETEVRYELRTRNYTLSDTPEGTHSVWSKRVLSSVPIPEPEGRVTPLFTWDISYHPEINVPVYGVEFADIDEDDALEKCYLLHGTTSGLFTWGLVIYKLDGTILCDNVYRTEWLDLKFVFEENGKLAVRGTTQKTVDVDGTLVVITENLPPYDAKTGEKVNVSVDEEPDVHVYQIVMKDGLVDLEEDGETLEPRFRRRP